jgi:hypothetical protein
MNKSCHDDVGNLIVNGGADENNPVNEQPGVKVKLPLTARGLFNDGRIRNNRILHGE